MHPRRLDRRGIRNPSEWAVSYSSVASSLLTRGQVRQLGASPWVGHLPHHLCPKLCCISIASGVTQQDLDPLKSAISPEEQGCSMLTANTGSSHWWVHGSRASPECFVLANCPQDPSQQVSNTLRQPGDAV